MTASWCSAADQLLGLQHDRFLCARSALLSPPSITDFKTVVKRLHDAGIEVLLDVVYNHTGRAIISGRPWLSRHRQCFVLPVGRRRRFYHDFTGTGNSLNFDHPRGMQLVMDAALLGERDACRRVPLRSRPDISARAWRV